MALDDESRMHRNISPIGFRRANSIQFLRRTAPSQSSHFNPFLLGRTLSVAKKPASWRQLRHNGPGNPSKPGGTAHEGGLREPLVQPAESTIDKSGQISASRLPRYPTICLVVGIFRARSTIDDVSDCESFLASSFMIGTNAGLML